MAPPASWTGPPFPFLGHLPPPDARSSARPRLRTLSADGRLPRVAVSGFFFFVVFPDLKVSQCPSRLTSTQVPGVAGWQPFRSGFWYLCFRFRYRKLAADLTAPLGMIPPFCSGWF